MSAVSNVRLKECRVILTRLTKEEIEKHTKKTFEEAEKIADLMNDIKPKIFVRTDIHTDVTTDIKTTQDTEGTSNPDHEILPDIIAPQNIQNYGINNEEINDTQVEDNMYAGPNDFMPMIYQQYVQNYMDINEGNGHISTNEGINYIPNMIIKQEIQDDNYGTYPLLHVEPTGIMIKQEVVDESYNYNNVGQGSHNMYGEYIPNILSDQPDCGMQNMTNQGTSNPHVIIKQEVFDEGNIEVFTDVLRPSADQGYEDGSPW